MAKFDGQQLAVARVYSDAMIQLAQERGEADRLLDELTRFAAKVDEDADLRAFLLSPVVDLGARTTAIEKMLRGKASDLLTDSLQVLNRKDRLGLIGAVAESYRLAHEELQGRVEVYVTTAAPLSKSLRARLQSVATAQAGKEADLVETVDESVIGGVVMQIGDRKLDASVASRLEALCGAMLERASREIHSGRSYFEGTAS